LIRLRHRIREPTKGKDRPDVSCDREGVGEEADDSPPSPHQRQAEIFLGGGKPVLATKRIKAPVLLAKKDESNVALNRNCPGGHPLAHGTAIVVAARRVGLWSVPRVIRHERIMLDMERICNGNEHAEVLTCRPKTEPPEAAGMAAASRVEVDSVNGETCGFP
jgi:hypothetical protein